LDELESEELESDELESEELESEELESDELESDELLLLDGQSIGISQTPRPCVAARNFCAD
jgi:hypothetical protein